MMLVRPRSAAWLAAILIACAAASATAQFQWLRNRESPYTLPPNPPYDGRFTFARLKFTSLPGGRYRNGFPSWGHEYPDAERNLVQILNAVTIVQPRLMETATIAIDDPELSRYPISYMTEP